MIRHAPETRTPSPPGAPPAAISLALAQSMSASRVGDDAIVGPTGSARSINGPYGRFLELGRDHVAKHRYMKYVQDGHTYRRRFIRKDPRPYLKPTVEFAVDSGMLLDIYAEHWLAAQEQVTV